VARAKKGDARKVPGGEPEREETGANTLTQGDLQEAGSEGTGTTQASIGGQSSMVVVKWLEEGSGSL